MTFRFHFKPADAAHRSLIHQWLKLPYVAEWFYGQGLENTIRNLDSFLKGSKDGQYWLAYDPKSAQERPVAFLITSEVKKPTDSISHWCATEGEAITLDMLIGDSDYLGKGLSTVLIREFLQSQFPHIAEVLIDPEATNGKAVHVYQKAGFEIVGEFIPSHSPHLHYMMRLKMSSHYTPPAHLE